EDIVKLDANENPYGPSPLVAQALSEAPYLHIYPDPESRELRSALAKYTGLDARYIMVGHGADELIDLILRLVIQAGDRIVNCPPTFGMYAFDAGINGAEVVNIWRNADFSIDLNSIIALFSASNGRQAKNRPRADGRSEVPKVIFVTSPNNPDGSLLSDHELEQLLTLPALVVLDEAYVEFGGTSRVRWVTQYANLIVLRTFSKWAGLAGLRVGYGAFPLELSQHLWKIKQPYNVNVAGQIAARVSLADREYLLQNVSRLIVQREQLVHTLDQFDWLEPYPGQANFILCRIIGRQAREVKHNLAEQGVLVRYYDSPGLSDHLRISIGTPTQMARLEEALKIVSIRS
ncbi:MAG: histidinol-phosphate transaminase, partial [Anaerolineae bacterium]|nr:histidinol-phosphate transaminase [Anaerolineae bacterium]